MGTTRILFLLKNNFAFEIEKYGNIFSDNTLKISMDRQWQSAPIANQCLPKVFTQQGTMEIKI